MNSQKATRVIAGLLAIVAGVLMIISANIMIAKFAPTYGDSTKTDALVIISYFLICVAVLTKLFSILQIANVKPRTMGILVIITQLALIALEITTVVLWTGMNNTVGALDITFMVFSVLAIIVALVYVVQNVRAHASYENA